MSRLVLRLILPVALVFAAVMSAIRAQPFDDSALRSFHERVSQGCEVPCFLGIQPLETTPAEALDHLRASDLVEQAGYEIESGPYITWTWNREIHQLNDAVGGAMRIHGGVIIWIKYTSPFRATDYYATLGPPLATRIVHHGSFMFYTVSSYYADPLFMIEWHGDCPFQANAISKAQDLAQIQVIDQPFDRDVLAQWEGTPFPICEYAPRSSNR